MANMYTFSANAGLKAGITLTTGALSLSQQIRPPHLTCGDAFIPTDRHWSKAPAALVEASVKTITTAKKPFNVFVLKRSDDPAVYLFVDFGSMNRVQRQLAADIKARRGVFGPYADDVLMQDKQGGNTFVRLDKQQHVDIWMPDGAIRRIVRQSDHLVEQALTLSEMTAMRVEQFEEVLSALDERSNDAYRVFSGVHNAALRLLKHPRLDIDSRDRLAAFLASQVGPNMHPAVRSEIRFELQAVGHLLAGNFIDGYAGNVVLFPKGNGKSRAEAERKRTERIERDRLARAAAKGSSNGQPAKQAGKGKKK